MTLAERVPEPVARVLDNVIRRSTVAMFAAGFLVDFYTITRIDAWTDLAIQLVYLAALTTLLVYQHRDALGTWTPPRRIERWWSWNVEALHFLYGGLLSAYVVLYFKSSTGARPLVFFVLLVGLMVLNEMPQLRRASHRLRLGLYAFCLLSFLNYFVPILVGRINAWVFLASLVIAAGLVWLLADRLAASVPRHLHGTDILEAESYAGTRARLFAPAGVVCALIAALYLLQLIPPVPLSVQVHGIYHDVRRQGGQYLLTYERPSRYFWRRDSRPFLRRPGDRLHYAARVFAPTRFEHQVIIRWQVQDGEGRWLDTGDRIPMDVVGGRAEGFRGYAVKSNFSAGQWRVSVETDDGRAIATLRFAVEDDMETAEREWHMVTW